MTEPARRVERDARLQWVPIPKMKVNPIAQRELKQARVDLLAAHFSLEDLGTPTVNKRDDYYFIIDGQHRIEALKQIGYGDQQVECWVYHGLSEQAEADRFLRLNSYLRVSAFDLFTKAVAARHPEETEIDAIVRDHGLMVSRAKVPGGIGCVGTLVNVYRRAGSQTLDRALTIAEKAYGDVGLDAHVIGGLALLCQRYNGQVDDSAAIERLGSARGGVDGLLGKARAAHKQRLGSLRHCVAAAAVEIINSGKGGKKLPVWWKS